MREILGGSAAIEDIKAFLLALKEKGESAAEVGALVEERYQRCSPIPITKRYVDIVGTGGDGPRNRAASSKSGSAELLEALGVTITLDGFGVARSVEELGIGFFASIFHPAMRFAAPARKELGIPMVFNILGPQPCMR